MKFLDKLYESNYFGIGLFAVISFLVVTFLVVLFFGKKDEKKRKLENANSINNINTENTFKEVSVPTPVEVPVQVPVAPIENVTPVMVEPEPVAPVNPMDFTSVPVEPVKPVQYEEDNNFVENLSVEEPVKVQEPVKPIEPVYLEPTKIETPISVEPLIKENEAPIITDVIEEPRIKETYYKPIEEPKKEEINVPNIDFDALAASISKELDDLEKTTTKKGIEDIKVTPISEISNIKEDNKESQFSSVYVSKPAQRTPIDLPKKIDLPEKKGNDIEPESYNI